MPTDTCCSFVELEGFDDDGAEQLFDRLLARLGTDRPLLPAAFLDSADHAVTPRPERSRVSVLAFSFGDEAELVRPQSETAVFEWMGRVWAHTGSPTSAEDAASDDDAQHGFQLGWVGALGYEYTAAFFRVTHAVVIDHARHRAELQTLRRDPAWEETVHAALADSVPPAGSSSSSGVTLDSLAVRDSREDYLAAIRAAQEEITAGNSYEVCLTTAVTARLHGHPWAGYRQLRRSNRAPFMQYLQLPGDAGHDDVVICSTSPERFLQISPAGTIRSEPIKGTRGRGASAQQDAALRDQLRHHPKDRAENVMIADLVRNDLSVHARTGSLRTERLCAVETYPSVHQMVSTVSAQIAAGTAHWQAVQAAFPPGSMTGAPKRSTVQILQRLESGPRGPYSGAAGYFSANGGCDLSVLIRTAVLRRSTGCRRDSPWSFHLGLGGAITADSDPEAEWDEVVTKSRGVLGALGAAFPAA